MVSYCKAGYFILIKQRDLQLPCPDMLEGIDVNTDFTVKHPTRHYGINQDLFLIYFKIRKEAEADRYL